MTFIKIVFRICFRGVFLAVRFYYLTLPATSFCFETGTLSFQPLKLSDIVKVFFERFEIDPHQVIAR